MNVNALLQYLKIANDNSYGGKGYTDTASSYDPSGLRLDWAAKMAQMDRSQQAPPNFFASGGGPGEQQPGVRGPGSQPPPTYFASGEGLDRYAPAPYVQPERFNPGQRRYGPDSTQNVFGGPDGSTGNYLSQLLRMGAR